MRSADVVGRFCRIPPGTRIRSAPGGGGPMPRPLNGGGDGTVASFGYNGTTPEVGIRDISGIEEAVLYADVEDVYIEGVPT